MLFVQAPHERWVSDTDGPRLNNWDISLFRNFQLGSNEARRLQSRFESYNTFNHTLYSGIDTGARFDWQHAASYRPENLRHLDAKLSSRD